MTTLARKNDSLRYDIQFDGWCAVVRGGGYAQEESQRVAGALMNAQINAFESMLPEGCFWLPGEIVGPEGTDLNAALEAQRPGLVEDPIDDVMKKARLIALDQIDEIEADRISNEQASNQKD